MNKKDDPFYEEYANESVTDVATEPTEEKRQAHTVTGSTGDHDRYDKSKPYRVVIRAKEVKG